MTPEFEVRYFLEHKVLPVAFYGDGEHLRKTLIHDSQNIMLQFYEHAEEVTSNYVCPYGPEDFELSARTYIRNDQFCIVLRMGMPQVEAPLLCRAVYLCYGSNETEVFYITSELAETGEYFLCGWSNKGMHFNFGVAPDNKYDEIEKSSELFWKMISDGGLEEAERVYRHQERQQI